MNKALLTFKQTFTGRVNSFGDNLKKRIKQYKNAQTGKLNLKNIVKDFIFVILLVILVLSITKIVLKLFYYYRDDWQYKEIREMAEKNTPVIINELLLPPPDPDLSSETFMKAASTDSTNLSEPLDSSDEIVQNPFAIPYIVQYADPGNLDEDGCIKYLGKLRKINNETVGWLKVPGFKKPIDYPVMQTKDNEYYLNKDFYGNYSYAGSLFMDAKNSFLETDRNTIIYGHAMNDYSMFGNFKTFPERPEDLASKTIIQLDLLNTHLEYQIFSAYYEKSNYNYRQTVFNSDQEYMDFLNRICENSVYDYDMSFSPNDKILTLSTCNNNIGKEIRSIIHARLVRQIRYAADTVNIDDNKIKSCSCKCLYFKP